MQGVQRAYILSLLMLVIAVGTAPATQRTRTPAAADSQLDSRGFELFESGQRAHQQGKLDEAVKLYDQAIALEPELWTAYYQRGVALLQLGRPADAEPSLRKAVELESDFAAASAALGQALLALDRAADAEKHLARALEIDPSVAGARANYAIALWKRAAYADVDRELTLLEKEKHATADSFVLHGQALEHLNRPADATAAYSAAIAADPTDAAAFAARGRLRAANGDKDGAISDFNASLAIRRDPDVASDLARLTGSPLATDDAIEALKAKITADPRDFASRRALADALARANRMIEARKEIEALETLAPNDPETYDVAGDVVLGESAIEAARKYVQAVRLAPDNVDYRLKLGSALIRAGQYEAALQHLEFAVAKAPDRKEAHSAFAAALYGTAHYGEAAVEFAWLASNDPKSALAQFFLGACLDRIGDCKGALEAFERFLALANPVSDKLKIDEVNLRAPAIRRQMDRGDCKKLPKKA